MVLSGRFPRALIYMQKGGDLTQSNDKTPTPTETSKGQSDNTNNATKKFD